MDPDCGACRLERAHAELAKFRDDPGEDIAGPGAGQPCRCGLGETEAAVRRRNRCRLCGRPRAYLRKFALCRLCFRSLALEGDIAGVTKSSW